MGVAVILPPISQYDNDGDPVVGRFLDPSLAADRFGDAADNGKPYTRRIDVIVGIEPFKNSKYPFTELKPFWKSGEGCVIPHRLRFASFGCLLRLPQGIGDVVNAGR